MKRYIKASTTSGYVGIWWYISPDDNIEGISNEVIGVSCSLEDGYNDGNYIQYGQTQNHMNLWRIVTCKNLPENVSKSVYDLGYRGLERGRVIFNLRTQCYEVTCSEELSHDEAFKREIKNAYMLHGCRCELVTLDHYKKLPLTGNPAVDDQILNLDF